MEPTTDRPDVDIEEDIKQIINTFTPLKTSKPYFTLQVSNGVVTVQGNVRNPQARRVLLDNAPRITGVQKVDASAFFDDEQVRYDVGGVLPPGVHASVLFGAVALTGKLPEHATAEAIITLVSQVAGVRRVGVDFGEAKTG
ncbi:MAG TPA: BON domain-containing protein [Aggregatilineales bacterium]|nr:BON domain-containing protein [Anaerolineales bacterium]HRE46120.1 BON domain-containing protein [Aggregatilineales bacterium]